jgi:thiol-disulfide isomerase/thioredoxin
MFRSIPILSLVISLTACTREGVAEPQEHGIAGKKAPELGLTQWVDASGQASAPISLASLKGKIVILEFWQSWCPGCHSHGLPTLKLIKQAFESEPRVAMLGIQTVFEGHHVNTFDKLATTQKRHQLDIPMAHDPGTEATGGRSTLMGSYRSGGTPWFVLIDHSGTVIYNDFNVDGPRAIEYIRSLLEKIPSSAKPVQSATPQKTPVEKPAKKPSKP